MVNLLKRIPIIFILLIASQNSRGQELTGKEMAISCGYHRGFLIAHRPTMVPLQKNHLNALELNIIKRTDGKKQWQEIYGYPEIGISLSLWDMGNHEQLGLATAVIPYIDFVLEKGAKHSLDLKFGWGIGYVEKKFDADNNYKNTAIGSHLNCALTLQPHYKIKLADNLHLAVGLSISHFSNGGFVTPNLGANLASINGNLTYGFGKKQEFKHSELPIFKRSTHFTIFGSGSVKQVYPANGNNYFACTLSGNFTRQTTRKSGFGAGADLFYDNSIYHKLEEEDVKLNNSLETLRFGLHGSYELILSDFSFMVSMGGYLYTKLEKDGNIYHRIGLRYRFSKKMFACMNLKTHWAKADFIEWGLGYRIDYIKK